MSHANTFKKGNSDMDPAGFLTTKNWVFGALLVMGVGITKIVRDVARGVPMPLKAVLSELASTGIGGALALFISLGLELNENFVFASIMIGSWMGVSLFRVGEAELRKRYGVDRRHKDPEQ